MAFESYITYEEYVTLGGTVSEGAFPVLERKAQRHLDYITYDRIKYCTSVPDIVKEVLVEFIDKLNAYEEGSSGALTATKYSNGVESFTFDNNQKQRFDTELTRIAYKWLPDYLVARSVNFDVEEYLQSKNNNP